MPFDSCEREPKHAVDYLSEAVADVRTPEHWCQGHFNLGDQWCILGAVAHQVIGHDARLISDYREFRERMRQSQHGSQMRECISLLYSALPWSCRIRRRIAGRSYAEAITRFNDSESRSHTDVLLLFTSAIARARNHVIV